MSSNVYPWQSLVHEGLANFCVVKSPKKLLRDVTVVDPVSSEDTEWSDAIEKVVMERKDTIRLVALMQVGYLTYWD